MFQKMKIGKRLRTAFGLMTISFAVIIGITIASGIRQQDNYRKIIDEEITANELAIQCRNNTNRSARNLREMFLISDKSKQEDMYQRFLETKDSALQGVEKLVEMDPLGDGSIPEYASTVKNWAAEAEQVAATLHRGDITGAVRMIDQKCRPALEAMGAASKVVDENLNQQIEREKEQITRQRQNINRGMGLCVLLVIAMMLQFANRIVRGVVDPTEEARRTLLALSQGDFSVHTNYDGQDELGDMCRTLRKFRAGIEGIIQDQSRMLGEMAHGNFDLQSNVPELYVGGFAPLLAAANQIIDQLNDLIAQIDLGADEVATGAEQVSNGAQGLAQGATEQASAVEELSASIAEIADAAQENAKISAAALQGSHEAGKFVGESAQNMREMVTAMEEINNSSEEIGKIIATIENIAFQTNILALNAAVEAARAGAAGKGFAVVADEVRNLAAKSDEAAKATKELISSSIESVRKGDTIVKQVAQSLQKTMEAEEKVNREIERIADAVSEEAESISQVTQGIDQIASVVQTNSATSEESAAASEELSGQAQVMKDLLAQFHLKGMDHQADQFTPSAPRREYPSAPNKAESRPEPQSASGSPTVSAEDNDSPAGSAFSKY